jgi:hypothetical protein
VFLLETKSNDLVAEVFDGGVSDLGTSVSITRRQLDRMLILQSPFLRVIEKIEQYW